MLAGDAGHRGPVDCGAGHQASLLGYRTKMIDTVLGPAVLRRGYNRCGDCRGGVVPRDDQLDVAGVSLSTVAFGR